MANGPVLPASAEWSSGGFDMQLPNVPTAPPPPRPPARLSIVLPFIEREVPRVLSLLDWMARLSGQLNRTVFLLPIKNLDAAAVAARAAHAFSDVQLITDSEGVSSDWKRDEKIRDAAGPNSLFRQAAWFFYFKPIGPWLWLEPDCLPLVKTWDMDFEAAYRANGKPYMGVKMHWQNGDEYLNGAAIYPPNAAQLTPSLVTRTMWTQKPELEIAFDVAGGKEVIRYASATDLIQLEYRTDEPHELRPGAVLFHGDRAGKILETLAGSSAVEQPVYNRQVASSNPAPPKSSKRKRGDAKCAVPVLTHGEERLNPTAQSIQPASNGAVKVQTPAAPSVGDEIRYHSGALARLATNSNRKTRIVRELRKLKLVRK